MDIEIITNELEEAALVLRKFIDNKGNIDQIKKSADMIIEAFKDGKKIISCGNGGSHCDAMHFAEELTGRYRESRAAYPAIAISDPSHISCVGNDYGYPYIFSRYIEALGSKGDILFCLSTSGNSENILKAAEVAKSKEMKVIALTGNSGGKLSGMADREVCVPHHGYADRIQEIHIKIIHIIICLIERGLKNEHG